MSQRRSIVDFPRNEAGLVDEFLGTAFDAVYQIYLNLQEVLNSKDYAVRAEAAKVAAQAAALAAQLSESNAHESELAAAQYAADLSASVLAAIAARDSSEASAIQAEAYLTEVRAIILNVSDDRAAAEASALQAKESADKAEDLVATIDAKSSPTPNAVIKALASGLLNPAFLPTSIARTEALEAVSLVQDTILNSHERLIFKKKKILSLPMKSPEWDYLLTLGIRFYPQAFCLDEDAGKLLILDGSTPNRTVLVYDWPTGTFDRVFFCASGNIVTEGAVVRTEGANKYLYQRQAGDVLAKYDITVYPVARSTITATSTTVGPGSTAVPCGLNAMERQGIWTISDPAFGALNNVRSRGKFTRYDKDFNLLGSIDCGDLLMGIYAGRNGDTAVTKAQGVTDTGYGLVAQMGGQWVAGDPVTNYGQHGLRVFTYDGLMTQEGLIQADKFASVVAANWGFTPAVVEAEGVITDRSGRVFSLTVTSNNGVSTASSVHGILIMQEFCHDGLDFSPVGAPRTSAAPSRGSLIRTPTGDVLFDNISRTVITNVGQLIESLLKAGQTYWAMYTTGMPLVDTLGVAYPGGCLLELVLYRSDIYYTRLSGNGVTIRKQVYYNTGTSAWAEIQRYDGDGTNVFSATGLTINRLDGGPTINMDGPTASIRQIVGKTAGVNRWRLAVGDSIAEATGDVGSNFAVTSYTDAGVYKATPLQVVRSSGETQVTSLSSAGPAKLGVFTLATLPSAAAYVDYFILVSNATGGRKLCYSNGTNWCLVNTTTVVS